MGDTACAQRRHFSYAPNKQRKVLLTEDSLEIEKKYTVEEILQKFPWIRVTCSDFLPWGGAAIWSMTQVNTWGSNGRSCACRLGR